MCKLLDLFERNGAHPASRIEEFLPDRWLAIRQAEPEEDATANATSPIMSCRIAGSPCNHYAP